VIIIEMGRKKKGAAAAAKAAAGAKAARRSAREERRMARSAKKEHRKRDRKTYTADMWAVPAPSHLIARLEVPKRKSKYHSYFEFAENTEKKKKRLEFKVHYLLMYLVAQLTFVTYDRLQMIRIHHRVSNLSPSEIQL
jgi:hypothetical protein